MDLSLLYVEGCPHRSVAEERLGAALLRVGRGGHPVTHVVVETLQDAERLGFVGSPTILVDGRDPFASGATPAAVACRVYDTPDGPEGAPTVEQLVEVLS